MRVRHQSPAEGNNSPGALQLLGRAAARCQACSSGWTGVKEDAVVGTQPARTWDFIIAEHSPAMSCVWTAYSLTQRREGRGQGR